MEGVAYCRLVILLIRKLLVLVLLNLEKIELEVLLILENKLSFVERDACGPVLWYGFGDGAGAGI